MSLHSRQNTKSCPISPMLTNGFSIQAPTPGNSLGRVKCPCHVCAEANLEYDGQCSRCFVCMQNQIPCRGYKLELSWQSGVTARGNLGGFTYPVGQSTPQPLRPSLKVLHWTKLYQEQKNLTKANLNLLLEDPQNVERFESRLDKIASTAMHRV